MAEGSVCKICMEAKPGYEMRNSTNKCSHMYCSKCITKHITTKVEENMTLITCPDYTCLETLEPHLYRDIISRQVLDCWESTLRESAILPSDKFQHKGRDEDMLLIQLAEKNKWRKCPGCKYYVERTRGCMHITCRCGSEFCYGCGANWSDTHESVCERV
ncbi:hypothetical protein MKX01_039505 [Papaver californicum]|nr:hypothetical protein MKX01_039505 [Papaver californicum]